MLKAFIFLSFVYYLFSQASCVEWDDINNDEELGDSSRKAVESPPNTYKFFVYPWQQWNPHFYQPIARNLHVPIDEIDHQLIHGDRNGHSGYFRQFGSLESPFFPSSPSSFPTNPSALPSDPSSVPLSPSLLPVSQTTQPFDSVIIESGIRQELIGESCRSLSREMGNCFDSTTCTTIGGRASGLCTNGLVCCISTVNTCDDGLARLGDTVTLNNTYWQSPLRTFAASSSCTLTVKLDSTLPEQNNVAVCQVRLDFVLFEISQPDAETVCSNDYFDVAGATNVVPTICGFNNGQHMYLHVPPSPTDVQLTFNFGPLDTDARRWNILIAMIPCNSKLLEFMPVSVSKRTAPSDCLQYFTARTGTVKTFNWRDVTGTATRQLANQGYSICFRSALTQRQLCLTPCTVVTTQKAFSISVARTINAAATATPDASQLGSLNCNNDFLIIPGGFNIGNPTPVANMAFDRYCGERLNALPGATVSTTVCSMVKPFRIVYHANRDETLTIPTADTTTAGNIGFCLSFLIPVRMRAMESRYCLKSQSICSSIVICIKFFRRVNLDDMAILRHRHCFKWFIIAVIIFGCILTLLSRHVMFLRPQTLDYIGVRKFIFMKTHKCGSTTIANIVFRFALKNELNVVLPAEGNILSTAELFDHRLLNSTKWRDLNFDIFALHNRWNKKEVLALLREDVPTFTIVREPVEAFESLFQYMDPYMKEFYGAKDIHDMVRMLQNASLSHVMQKRFMGYIGRNQIAFDLGLSPDIFDNATAVAKEIERLDREFHLVMISNRMDESVILLRELLNWPLQNVVHLDLNRRKPKMYSRLSAAEKKVLEKWLAADVQIFQYFSRRFDEKVAEYNWKYSTFTTGLSDVDSAIKRETRLLEEANRQLYDRCVISEVGNEKLESKYKTYKMPRWDLLPRLPFVSPDSSAWDDEKLLDNLRDALVTHRSYGNPYVMARYPWRRWNPLSYYAADRIPSINPVFNSAYFRQGNDFENPFPGDVLDTELSTELDEIQDVDTRQLLGGQGESCRSPTTREMGICLDSGSCTLGGGRASGSCATGLVCCINVINTCDDGFARQLDTVTVNNTYWQSPVRTIAPSSSCTLTVKLDSALPSQVNQPICQVRLDFVLFAISQPDSDSVCNGDYFEVSGTTNTVPTICGFNNGQHMYLHVPPAPNDVQLTFNFGPAEGESRQWNILISMIPCNSRILAPPDCLQYFTTRSGSVRTFNWRDVTGTATRQLANQDYSICFRSGPTQRQLCLTPCTVVTTQKAFSISVPVTFPATGAGVATNDVSQFGSLNCNNDFLVIPGGFNLGNPAGVTNMAFDRYCGERLNALPGNAASTTVCTTMTPLRIFYRTNRDETITPTIDSATNGNRGFCLNFRVQ
ncbi:hypothetical protein GHT06_015973 [Daphnia sinensis]|uniref:CUB domain-containing protein n=1 Tax=Daphnia sinensis TaxID=1820382 RepID=A0AAD5PWR1_9CRUS|nr:hypothetical protein GHT06_015973 [Daphnia sinensis]